MPDEYASDIRDFSKKTDEQRLEEYLWQDSIRKAHIYCQKLAKKKENKEVKES